MNYLAMTLIVFGILIFSIGVVGILRLPDFYSRMHAAGKSDSLAAVLMIFGFAIYNLQDFSLVSVLVSLKIVFIALFIFLSSPTATHAIVETALVLGAEPWHKEKETK